MGSGTRLGHTGPKGTYDICLESHKSIFELLLDTIKQSSQKYNVKIPWYIMTSRENNEETVSFFEKNNYFNYGKENIIFFIQGELPMINEEGKILLSDKKTIKRAADGHGAILHLINSNKILQDMKNKNIKWIFINGVDNILAKMVDPTLLGLTIDKKVLAGAKSIVKRAPEEKVGVFCRKNGKPSVIEYMEIPKGLSEARNKNGELQYGEAHILNNLFNIKFIEEVGKEKMPYHCAHKKVNYINENGELIIAQKPNAYKFEAFLFDAFDKLDDIAIMRVKREDEFAPIKNKEGEDSPETAKKLYMDFQIKNNKK